MKRAREGGAYEGNSRKAGDMVARGTGGYLTDGSDGLVVVVVVVVVVVSGDGTVDNVVLAETCAS